MGKQWKRICPKCRKELFYSTKGHFDRANKNVSTCRDCCLIGNKWGNGIIPWNKGLTCETSEKMKMLSEKVSNTLKGIKIPKDVIKKRVMSRKINGYRHSQETINKMKMSNTGKVRTEEAKQKMRISKLKRLELLGIAACTDKGSIEFFKWMNGLGFNFKPKTFMNIGYVADGYDENKHIWIEYDTPYHNFPNVKNRDLIRQNNIINYFKNIGNPLNGFVRIKVDKDNNIITTECVYKAKWNEI